MFVGSLGRDSYYVVLKRLPTARGLPRIFRIRIREIFLSPSSFIPASFFDSIVFFILRGLIDAFAWI